MFKTVARLALIGLCGLITSGCWVFGFGAVRAVRVTALPPGVSPPNQPLPAPQPPTITLEYAAKTIPGVQSSYNWVNPNGSGSGSTSSSIWPPIFPGTLLAPAGQSLTISINYTSPPAVLFVTELDGQGIPMTASVLQPATNAVPYRLANSGQYTLQITAQWSSQNYVTYLFAVDVTP